MESGAKLLGHPVHPMLIVFPLGLLTTAVAFDVVHLISGESIWAVISYWMIVAGIVGGFVAAVPGLVDWLGLPRQSRAYRVGMLHAGVNALALLLFIASWALRRGDPAVPPSGALALGFVALLVILVGGWLGGELVDRMGVGVDDGANVDAPSSLSTSKASSDSQGRRAA